MAPGSNNLSIGDLIEIADVKTVIDVAEVRDLDADDPEGRLELEELNRSFVITEDILQILSVVYNGLSKPSGHGYFVIGTYGSGKSHLLSVLGLSSRYSWARTAIIDNHHSLQPLLTDVAHQKLLPVMVPLTEYTGDTPLERIIWRATELTAAVNGIPLNLSYTLRFIELFNRYILPVHMKDFRHFVEMRFEDVSWEQICRDDPASAHTIIQQYMTQNTLEIPFSVSTDRKTLIIDLISSVKDNGWDGIIFIIDELSEFLKSKPSKNQLNEDTRFLQFLGETSVNTPIWIIAAVQETIERTGEIAPEVFKKIKDRFQQLRLTTKHLHELISKRLIQRKSPESNIIIKNIYRDLKRSFNRIPVTEDLFETTYPVHPETLELLNQNIDLFSQRRGVVDFLTARIKGRKELNIDGILDHSCEQLLTPDTIFDHFLDRFSESEELSAYYFLFQQNLSSKILQTFTDLSEQSAAFKTVKILIILSVSPLKEKRTVRELANMILFNVMDPSLAAGDANYVFFEERIIQPLYQQFGFLTREKGKTRLDDIYRIKAELSSTESVTDQLERIKHTLTPDYGQLLRKIINTMGHGLLPIAIFSHSFAIRDSVKWQNTRRKIALSLIEKIQKTDKQITSIQKKIDRGEIDLAVVFLLPGDYTDQVQSIQFFLSQLDESVCASWIFVIPRTIDLTELRMYLLEYEACHVLQNQLAESSELDINERSELVQQQKELKMESVRCLLVNSYLQGEILNASGRIEGAKNHKKPDSFDDWIEAIVQTPLNQRYPKHIDVAPEGDVDSRIFQELLLEKFIKPGKSGKLNRVKDNMLQQAIESVLIPVKLAEKKGAEYFLTCNTRRSRTAALILQQLPVTQIIGQSEQIITFPAGRIWLSLKKSEYGISRPIFDITLCALIKKGYVNAYLKKQPVNLDSLHLPLSGQIDRLSRGNLIDEELKPAFLLLHKLLTGRNLKDIDLDAQESLWKKLLTQVDLWENEIQAFQNNLSLLENRFNLPTGNLDRTNESIESVKNLRRAVQTGEIENTNWEPVLSQIMQLTNLQNTGQDLGKIRKFNENGMNPLVIALSYLRDTRLTIPQKPDFALLNNALNTVNRNAEINDDFVFSNGLKKFLDTFESFRNEYIERYILTHTDKNQWIQEQNYGSLVETPEATLLSNLHDIPLIRQHCVNRTVLDLARNYSRHICKLNPRDYLTASPVCQCGHQLGETIGLPTKESLVKQMNARIKQIFGILNSEKVVQEINSDIDKFPEQTQRKLQMFSKLDTEAESFENEFSNLLENDLQDVFMKHSFPNTKTIKLSLSELVNLLKGQTLTISGAKDTIEEWLHQRDASADDFWLKFEE